jgi:uncharacterized protein with HEPN domain
MRRETAKLLRDMADAAEVALAYIAGRSLEDYLENQMLRDAVERELTILGEAMVQLRRTDAQVAASFDEGRKVAGMRNILVHRYSSVDDDIIWQTCRDSLPQLRDAVVRVLRERDAPG